MAKKVELNYSQAVAEIDQIITRLRNEQMDVDLLATEVQRATELIALCKERLHKAEQEVKKVFE